MITEMLPCLLVQQGTVSSSLHAPRFSVQGEGMLESVRGEEGIYCASVADPSEALLSHDSVICEVLQSPLPLHDGF